jgi:hypothetical protein
VGSSPDVSRCECACGPGGSPRPPQGSVKRLCAGAAGPQRLCLFRRRLLRRQPIAKATLIGGKAGKPRNRLLARRSRLSRGGTTTCVAAVLEVEVPVPQPAHAPLDGGPEVAQAFASSPWRPRAYSPDRSTPALRVVVAWIAGCPCEASSESKRAWSGARLFSRQERHPWA